MKSAKKPTGVTHSVSAEDGIVVGEGIVVRIQGDEKEISQSQDSRGRVRIAEMYADEIRARISGFEPPQGEANSELVCRQLVAYLNRKDGRWSDPKVPGNEYGVDCIAQSPDGVLQIQVTAVDPQHWETVAHSTEREAEWVVDFEAAAQVMLASVEGKARKLADRGDIILALDAIHWPVYALGRFVDMFRTRHGQAVSDCGFAAVYVVGPALSDVARVDSVSGGSA